MDSRIVPSEQGFFVGKCQSCAHSQENAAPRGLLLFCHKDADAPQQTRANWQCGRYEYEPGSLG